MCEPYFSFRSVPSTFPWAPASIGLGFAVLLLGVWWSAAPVVTAMALVAMGATGATIHRLRVAPSRFAVTAGHLFVYLNLYFLFVGAVCHAAVPSPSGELPIFTGVDLVVSVIPMAIVMWQSFTAMAGGGDATAR